MARTHISASQESKRQLRKRNVSTYFKPLRRKLGVVTLLLACAFAAIWIRSFYCTDDLLIGFSTSPIHSVLVLPEGFQIFRSESLRDEIDPLITQRFPYCRWSYYPNGAPTLQPNFYLYKGRFKLASPFGMIVAHWPIVLSLTLLSAWLLLLNPQVTKQNVRPEARPCRPISNR